MEEGNWGEYLKLLVQMEFCNGPGRAVVGRDALRQRH